jgi:predicted ATP-dependent protease
VHGNVNPVGGVAENLSAALRQGRKLVIIPAENATELGRLEELAAKLEIHPVRTLKEAVRLVLVDADEDARKPIDVSSVNGARACGRGLPGLDGKPNVRECHIDARVR